MMWIIELIQFFILAVNCQCILGQIIRSDTEEIYHLCQFVTDDRCCRSLNHDSLFRNLILNLLCFQLFFYFCYDLINFLYFFCRSNHRIHDRKISINGCTEKCTKLSFEDFRLSQTNTDRTVSHSRIIFITKIEIIYLFISSDIQRTDNNLLTCHHLYCLLVSLELFLLSREIISSKIQEFTSEKSDSTGIVFHYITNIANASNVCINIDLTSVQSNVFFAFEFLKKFQFLSFFLHFGFCLNFCLFIRIKSNDSLETVYNRCHSTLKSFQIHFYSDQCRNIHHTCKNRCMRIGRSVNCYKCKDLIFVHLDCLAWTEIIRYNYRRLDRA